MYNLHVYAPPIVLLVAVGSLTSGYPKATWARVIMALAGARALVAATNTAVGALASGMTICLVALLLCHRGIFPPVE